MRKIKIRKLAATTLTKAREVPQTAATTLSKQRELPSK